MTLKNIKSNKYLQDEKKKFVCLEVYVYMPSRAEGTEEEKKIIWN